ncbi:MAG: hypothetical protein IMY72_05995 [Bacteroidetes bacterium]|nr:hypothetical protein [Bacteroidota bacterium]
MEKKIEIKICIGTLCYVMGGSELQLLAEHLPEKFKKRVDIIGSTCLDYCLDQEKYGKAPFVEINGEVMAEASINKVIDYLIKKY